MVAVAEGQMEVRMSGHVEAIGVREMRRVPVGRAQHGQDELSAANGHTGALRVRHGHADLKLDGAVEAQALLHGVRYQGGLRAKPRKLFRVLELCLRLQRGAACGAGGVMAWERGRGEGARGRGGR